LPHQIPAGVGQANAIATIKHPASIDGHRDSLFRHVIELGRQHPPTAFAICRAVQRLHQDRRPRQRAIGLAFMRTIASQRGSGERSSARGAGSSVLTYRIKHRKPCAGLTPQFSRSSHAQLTLRPTPASFNAGRARSCPAHMWHFSPWRMPERSTPHGSRSSSAAFLRFTR
jgi:hypothetical protein